MVAGYDVVKHPADGSPTRIMERRQTSTAESLVEVLAAAPVLVPDSGTSEPEPPQAAKAPATSIPANPARKACLDCNGLLIDTLSIKRANK
jgi:hypothetical protein